MQCARPREHLTFRGGIAFEMYVFHKRVSAFNGWGGTSLNLRSEHTWLRIRSCLLCCSLFRCTHAVALELSLRRTRSNLQSSSSYSALFFAGRYIPYSNLFLPLPAAVHETTRKLRNRDVLGFKVSTSTLRRDVAVTHRWHTRPVGRRCRAR